MFVDELFSVYCKYAKQCGLESELLLSTDGRMVAKITGKDAGKRFANESGKHCVQRVPPTESNGRKQTSMVSVAVLPVPKDVDTNIDKRDLKIEAVNLGGKGGQHQNRTLSGCRITYKPLKMVVSINGRDYHSNEREALRVIAARIADHRKAEADSDYAAYRRLQLQGGHRSGKVRTYNLLESRVVDHRLNRKTSNVKAIMKGRLDLILGDC